jgi:hypothetical protein
MPTAVPPKGNAIMITIKHKARLSFRARFVFKPFQGNDSQNTQGLKGKAISEIKLTNNSARAQSLAPLRSGNFFTRNRLMS